MSSVLEVLRGHLHTRYQCNYLSSNSRWMCSVRWGCETKARGIRGGSTKSRLLDSNREPNCHRRCALLGIWPYLYER